MNINLPDEAMNLPDIENNSDSALRMKKRKSLNPEVPPGKKMAHHDGAAPKGSEKSNGSTQSMMWKLASSEGIGPKAPSTTCAKPNDTDMPNITSSLQNMGAMLTQRLLQSGVSLGDAVNAGMTVAATKPTANSCNSNQVGDNVSSKHHEKTGSSQEVEESAAAVSNEGLASLDSAYLPAATASSQVEQLNIPLGSLPSSIEELFASSSSDLSHTASRSPLVSSRASSEAPIFTRQSMAQAPPPVLAAKQKSEAIGAQKLDDTPAANTVLSGSGHNQVINTDGGGNLALDDSVTHPARIKLFLALPMDRFFVQQDSAPSSENPMLHSVSPPPYLSPSNYDVLCGPGRAFFHHIGNRRFRIMIEMSSQRYAEAYLASNSGHGDSIDSIQELIKEMLQSLSECNPPGRFLGMDMTTGQWRMLNPVFRQLKTEQSFLECLQVNQRRQARILLLWQEEEQRQLQAAKLMEDDATKQCEDRWRSRIETEKESLIMELEDRMISNGEVMSTSTMGSGLAPATSQLARQTINRRVSQSSLLDGSATSLDRNSLQLLAAIDNEGHSAVQFLAQELQRGHSSAGAVITGGSYQAATAQGTMNTLRNAASTPTTNELEDAAITAELIKRHSREHQSTATDEVPRALLNSLRYTGALPHEVAVIAAALAAQSQTQRNSLPILYSNLSSLTSSFSSQDANGGGRSPALSFMSNLRSDLPCQPSDSIQSSSEQQLVGGSVRRPAEGIGGRLPSQAAVASSLTDYIQLLSGQQVTMGAAVRPSQAIASSLADSIQSLPGQQIVTVEAQQEDHPRPSYHL